MSLIPCCYAGGHVHQAQWPRTIRQGGAGRVCCPVQPSVAVDLRMPHQRGVRQRFPRRPLPVQIRFQACKDSKVSLQAVRPAYVPYCSKVVSVTRVHLYLPTKPSSSHALVCTPVIRWKSSVPMVRQLLRAPPTTPGPLSTSSTGRPCRLLRQRVAFLAYRR